MVQSSRAFGENFAARFRNPDAVFELGRQRSIAGDGGPSVLQHLHAGLADIDHRLDGEEHAGLQFRAVARAADMHDFGRVVKDPAKAMTTEVADNTVPEFFRMPLDRIADVAHRSEEGHTSELQS